MKNPLTLLSGQFSPVTAAKISFLVKVIRVFVKHALEKSQTEKNAILWSFGGF